MTIKELIKDLQQVLKYYGDKEVVLVEEFNEYSSLIFEINSTDVDQDYFLIYKGVEL